MISRSLWPLAVLMAVASSASSAADPARYMSAELIAESLTPAPGSTILVGLRFRPKPGWHGYWSNPGDAGFAPSVKWSAPGGLTFGPLLHPAPRLISAEGVSSYVHEGEHVLLSRLTVPTGVARGTPLKVAADASWAACTATMCVPLKASFTLDLTTGDGAKGTGSAAIAAARRELPRQAPGGAFSSDGTAVRLVLPAALGLDPRRARFFPDDNDAFRTASGRAEAGSDRLVIAGPGSAKGESYISGVASDGRAAYRLNLIRKEPEAATAQPRPVAETHAAAQTAQAPSPEQGKGSSEQADEKGPGRSSWVGLLIAALAAGATLFLRRRTS